LGNLVHPLEKLMMIEALIPNEPINPFRSRPATRLLSRSALRHRSDHRCLLRQDTTHSLWHYPPQAFFWQQTSDGRKKIVQRLFQLFNWHLGEDLSERYIQHGSASWVRFVRKQTLPQLAELFFNTYTWAITGFSAAPLQQRSLYSHA
jgi:hypothetical protein